VRVEEKAHASEAPGLHLGLGEGCEKGGRHAGAAPEGPEAAPGLSGPHRDEADGGDLSAGDDDLLAGLGLLDEAREVGLGSVDGNGLYGASMD
jgi:hypothetical protein